MFKRKKDENGNELENYLDVFIRNYKKVPGFRLLIKFGVYFIFIFIFVLIVSIGQTTKKEEVKEEKTEEKQEQKSYQEILNEFGDNKYKIKATINNNEKTKILNIEYVDTHLEGILESEEETKKFIIKDDNTYEIKMDNEILNNELLKDIDLDLILNDKVKVLVDNEKALKYDDESVITFSYNLIKNDINVKMDIFISNLSINKVTAEFDNSKYMIEYK